MYKKYVGCHIPTSYSSKLNTSLIARSSHCTSYNLLFLPTIFSLMCHHCGEREHLRPNCGKLSFHTSVKVNISTSFSSSLSHVTSWSQMPKLSHSFIHLCHLGSTVGHIARQCHRYVQIISQSSPVRSPLYSFRV